MFLEGTLYIFLIYTAILLAVIIFPIFFKKQWHSFINYFNKIELSEAQTRKVKYLVLCLGLSFLVNSCYMIALKNVHLFNALPGVTGFNIFATFAFLLLPIAIGLICLYGYLRDTNSILLGTFFLFLLCFLCFGFAGTNLHDLLWCGTRTEWFSIPVDAGYDLDLWINFFGCPSRDYRIFGFYMGYHVLIFCIYAFVNLWRYFTPLPKSAHNLKLKLSFLIAILIGFLGFLIFVFDYPNLFGPIITAFTIFLFIPLLIVPSYFVGKWFRELTQIHQKGIKEIEAS